MGSSNPKMWDSSLRTAAVILEDRLRDVGSIVDPDRIGRGLVNDVFGAVGTLTNRVSGYRNPLGYLIAVPLLVLEAMLAPLIVA